MELMQALPKLRTMTKSQTKLSLQEKTGESSSKEDPAWVRQISLTSETIFQRTHNLISL
jgi:hypothetical protein